MLLLMAIHFHSNQISNICELVCSTLGMKIPLRPNNTTRMKQIFVQEIFTEQVVTSHAVKVHVTLNLNANIPGYLPVHCIHQLLKSRAFSKHKVPIKSWIYKQICNSTTPLHPVLPALIEVYVTSIIMPNAKGPVEHTHKPLSESEIQKVFQNSVFGIHFGKFILFICDSNESIDFVYGKSTKKNC
jgi:integrator complex subunit 2